MVFIGGATGFTRELKQMTFLLTQTPAGSISPVVMDGESWGQPFLFEIENVKVYYAIICLNYDSTFFWLTNVLASIHYLLNFSINALRTQKDLRAQGAFTHAIFTSVISLIHFSDKF